MRNFHRLKNSDFILESKMAEPNQNKNSKQQDWSDAVILSTKGIYQSTDLVKFDVSSQKSKILHFYCFILSKSFKDSAKKVQRSYLSWHWKVMQSLKKNWLVVSNMTHCSLTRAHAGTHAGKFKCAIYCTRETRNFYTGNYIQEFRKNTLLISFHK